MQCLPSAQSSQTVAALTAERAVKKTMKAVGSGEVTIILLKTLELWYQEGGEEADWAARGH